MSTVSEIRTAIGTTLSGAITDLQVYRTVPDAVLNPGLVVMPNSADFTVAMGRGLDTWTFSLYVLASFSEPELGQNALDKLVAGSGPRSIRQVVFQNRSLGLPDVDAHISGMSGYGGQFEAAQIEHIGAILTLEAHTSGTS